jgi:2-oxoglutarate decarboxylase
VLDEVRGEPSLAPTHLPVHDRADADIPSAPTGVDGSVLRALATLVRTVPDGFTIHPKLERQFSQRDAMVAAGHVDWALAEALAIGSLLQEGVNVRLTGQDTRRGTFSHRHAVLVDYTNADELIPLAHLADGMGRIVTTVLAPSTGTLGVFTVRDSLLSEYAAVGFEYGYSVEAPEALVAWEAQFGDFANGAQIIIDNFLAAAEIKWGQHAGLVMLLPHGYEGQGPEHSSSRFERFLALCARGNMRVAIPSTSAQYFHLLRSQAVLSPKRPLIVVTPKSMLRAQASRSPLAELEAGSFAHVLDDAEVAEATTVRRIVLCSGKVAHEAIARRQQLAADDPEAGAGVAIVRVEQLYPWPIADLTAVVDRYGEADEVVWLQEEPENMGAWNFVHARLHAALPPRLRLRHVSRSESASPAIGSAALHQLEQADLMQRAIG